MKAEFVVQNKDGFSPISPETGERDQAGARRGDGLAAEHVPGEGRRVSAASRSGAASTRARSTRSGTRTSRRGRRTSCRRSPRRGIVLEKNFAEDNDFDVGDTLKVTTPRRQQADPQGARHVRGQGRPRRRLRRHGTTVIRRSFGQRDDFLRVRRRPARRRPEGGPGARRPGPGAAVPDRRGAEPAGVQGQHHGPGRPVPVLIYALLSLSVIVSLFGIVNTLVLSIHERTREIGMMRAIGTPRSLVRRIVRYESVITALIGAALGLDGRLHPGRRDDRRAQGRGLHPLDPGRDA